MKIINIKTEYLVNPIGIDIKNPRITWNLEDVKEQKAFQICYSVNGINKQTSIFESKNMYYDFNESFKSRDIVKFKIVAFCDGQKVESEENYFELGLLNQEDFIGRFITGNYHPNKNKRYPVDYFKKTFKVNNIVKARLYLSARGIYSAYLNGQRASNFVLAPGSTDYRKRIQYQTYDVTNLIKNGENNLEVLLGDGWYRGSIGAKGRSYVFGKETAIYCQLELTDDNNNVYYILSDDSWSWCNDGPIRFADLKDGEIIDNNYRPTYQNKAKFSKKSTDNLTASNNVFIEEHEVFSPISKTLSKNNHQVFCFKQNLAGYIAFEIDHCQKGQKIDIVLGEMLDEFGDVNLHNIQCVRKKKKTPLQEIHFICREGLNQYHSKFMIAGFKYAMISSDLDFKLENIKQIALYSSIEGTSTFECSNDLINTFYHNTLWSLKSNSADVPTDCPTRERMGWTGDSQVFFNTACYLTDYAAFSRKHLKDVFDRQDKNGRLPQIAPYNAEDWYMNVMNGSVGWADVGVLIPYRYYLKYNDDRLLKEYFDQILKYAEFMIKRCGRAKGIYSVYAKPLHLSKENRKFGVNTGQSYGEWAEPNDVKAFEWTDFCQPHPEESMAYTVYILNIVQEICQIVGRNEYLERLKYYSNGVKKAYQELITKPDFSLDTSRQAKLVRPLYMHLLTKEQEEYAKKRLIQALDFYKWRLGTGFLSTPFILDVLADIDIEYAYKLLLNEDMPGWLYMAKNDTGTIWEGWEGPNAELGISSLNHYSKGAMVEWLFHSMAGINLLPNNLIRIEPKVSNQIQYVNCAYQSIYGLIKVNWEIKDHKVSYKITIPANTTAEIIINNQKQIVTSGSYELSIILDYVPKKINYSRNVLRV